MAEFSYEQLIRKTGNIYEMVVVLSQRARQVTDEQKRAIESEKEYIPASDIRDAEDFDEVEIDREALNRDRVKYPKATTVALDDIIEEKVEFRYVEPDEGPAKS